MGCLGMFGLTGEVKVVWRYSGCLGMYRLSEDLLVFLGCMRYKQAPGKFGETHMKSMCI